MRIKVWHWLYCRWYDAKQAGHPKRSEAWGRLAGWACPR